MHNDNTGTTPILDTRIPEDRAVPGIEYGEHVSGPGWSGYYVRTTCPETAIARTTPASDELAGSDRDILIALDNELEAIHRERVDAIAGGLPIDQANEWAPGCQTWAIYYAGGQRGQITVWPNGRGAVAWGGNSAWGEWDGHVLTLDSGERVDASGQVLTDAQRFAAAMTHDGQRFETPEGTSFEALAVRMGAIIEVWREYPDGTRERVPRADMTTSDRMRYVFPDNSVIVAHGDGWDHEGALPGTWRG